MKERNDMQNRAEGEIELGADWSKSQPRQQEMWEAYPTLGWKLMGPAQQSGAGCP